MVGAIVLLLGNRGSGNMGSNEYVEVPIRMRGTGRKVIEKSLRKYYGETLISISDNLTVSYRDSDGETKRDFWAKALEVSTDADNHEIIVAQTVESGSPRPAVIKFIDILKEMEKW